MTPFVFHLVGPPASGKRTVGLHLSRLTGAVLLDNHLFNDAVFKPYGADGLRPIPDEIHALAAKVREAGLAAARLAPSDVHQIFTSYLTSRPSGPAALQLVREVAAARGATYVPVWLECDLEELCGVSPCPNAWDGRKCVTRSNSEKRWLLRGCLRRRVTLFASTRRRSVRQIRPY